MGRERCREGEVGRERQGDVGRGRGIQREVGEAGKERGREEYISQAMPPFDSNWRRSFHSSPPNCRIRWHIICSAYKRVSQSQT